MMKKAVITICLCTFIFNVAQSQDNSPRPLDNYFHVGFFQFFTGTFYLGYERMVNEKSSLLLSGGVTLVDQSYEERIGGQANIEYRFFALKGSSNDFFIDFDGVYLGPYLKYKNLNVTDIDEYASGGPLEEKYHFETVGGGVLVGIKLTVTDRIFFDFNLGGGIQYEFNEDNTSDSYWSGDIFSPGYTGVLPAGNFTFGLKF